MGKTKRKTKGYEILDGYCELGLIEVKKGIALGIRIHGPGRRPKERCITLIIGRKGMVTCGAFDVAGWTRKMGYVAAKVPGSGPSFDAALTKRVVAVTPRAGDLGVKVGLTGRKALELMM